MTITTAPRETGYAPVNGLELYYEIHGEGRPLILLHGGVVGIATFGPNVAMLAERLKVIGAELQGHGRTKDIDRPLSFEAMADDVAALIEHLGVERADVLGLSLGGGVALQLAIRHPDTVRKLVVVSAAMKRAGWYPEVRAAFDRMGPDAGDAMKQSPLNALYPNVDWRRLFGKLGELLRKEYDWSAQVAAISATVLIAFADADAVTTAHIMEFFGALGGGKRDAGLDGSARPTAQLAILPGLTHYNIATSPALPAVVVPFLEAPMPEA